MNAPSSVFPMQATMVALVWWKWVLPGVGVIIGLTWLSLKSYRRSVRKNLISYLKEAHPELNIVSEHGSHLIFQTDNVQGGQMNLHNLFSQMANAKAKTPEEERAVFKQFISGLIENMERASKPLSIESDGDFLLPRLMNEPDLRALSANGKIAHRPLDGTGLFVVYVRDSENAVSYLQEASLTDLQLDIPALHDRALVNLRKKTPPDFARKAFEQNALQLLKLGDTFDAARLLLIPEQLKADEAIAAVIPDRDTLGILPAPANRDWNELTKLSRAAAGPRLLSRPLQVTQNGFELIKVAR